MSSWFINEIPLIWISFGESVKFALHIYSNIIYSFSYDMEVLFIMQLFSDSNKGYVELLFL